VIEHQRAAVEPGREHVDRRRDESQPMTLQRHVAGDILPHEDVMREGRRLEPRMQVARDRPAADAVATLEDERVQSCLCEVKGRR
jgi:hypothetical protein